MPPTSVRGLRQRLTHTSLDSLRRTVGWARSLRLSSVGRDRSTSTSAAPIRRKIVTSGPPLLSVVVATYNVQDHLAECLDSVLDQTLDRIEVIIVDDGSTDHSPSIIADYAAADPRITMLTQPQAGLGAARNRGIEAATAPFITFLDTNDTIPTAAYAYMVNTLKRTGSDFVVGAVRGFARGKSARPAWVRDVHRVNRLHLRIEDFPDAMQDVIACNRVFRRQFWDAKVGEFPTGVAYEYHPPMVTAYVRAGSFDLLSATTSHVRILDDEATLWQQKHEASNLHDRIAVKELAWQVVSAEASPEVVAAWLGRVLDSELSHLLEYAGQADDDYRAILQRAARDFLERADAAALRHVRVERKLRLALAAAGEWGELDRTIEYFRVNGTVPATRIVDGKIMAELAEATSYPLEPELLELSIRESDLSACLESVAWRDGLLEVRGWAFIHGIDLTTSVPRIQAQLVRLGTQERVDLPVESFDSSSITRWANDPNHSYDRAGFRLRLPSDTLERLKAVRPARWQLVLRVETDGVTREGPVRSLLRSGIAMRMRAGELAGQEEPGRLIPVMDDRWGFLLQVRFDRVRATALESRGPHHLAGTIRLLRPLPSPLRHVVVRQAGRTVLKRRLTEQPDGTLSFDLKLPVHGRPDHWDFRVVDERGRFHRVSWPPETEHGHTIGPYGGATARWRRSPRGFVQVSSRPVVLSAHAVSVTDESVTVEVSVQGRGPGSLPRARLRGPLAEVGVARVENTPSGRYRLVFPATAALWGSERVLPLPSGRYGVELTLPSGQVVTCAVNADFMEQMPLESRTDTHGVTVARRPSNGELTITLGAPLADDERGAVAQRRLAQWYAATDFPVRDQVFFQCYRGEFATDSQRAIHEELFRRGTSLELVWGVHDLSVELPIGARPVLMGSREWYEVLASARYLCNNNDFDHFFHRRPQQKFLQTFHGYPFKSMGVSFWRARDFSAELIEYECRRRTDAWTSILVPASFCEDIYRQEYLYEGEILVTGYPRNDVLVNADPAARKVILDRLGVSPDKQVVLYAPTWRDTIATGDWSAKFFDALELDRLADALGDDYVVLLRGHNFNMREGVLKPAHATIVDVTRYPEIADLILAADVAVLDYSSLRFDWVLTGKPVLFFVPDLAQYLSNRTALFEYGPTAPGPLLSTTTEVIEALLDLESVSMDFAQARIDCNARFNGLHDGGATRRVVDAFFDPIGSP
ncbi:MAG: CDP-glycerol glycerophosphotransferase family protein [Propionibacteriaceae bacterium]